MLVEQQLKTSLPAWFLIQQVPILLIERENAQAQKRLKQELRDLIKNYFPDCVCKGGQGGLTDSPLPPFRDYWLKDP